MVYGYYTINGPSHCCHEEIEIDFDSGQIIWSIWEKIKTSNIIDLQNRKIFCFLRICFRYNVMSKNPFSKVDGKGHD